MKKEKQPKQPKDDRYFDVNARTCWMFGSAPGNAKPSTIHPVRVLINGTRR